MSDIEQLTVVVSCAALLIINRMPEDIEKIDKMGLGRLTLDLFITAFLLAGILFPLISIITAFFNR